MNSVKARPFPCTRDSQIVSNVVRIGSVACNIHDTVLDFLPGIDDGSSSP